MTSLEITLTAGHGQIGEILGKFFHTVVLVSCRETDEEDRFDVPRMAVNAARIELPKAMLKSQEDYPQCSRLTTPRSREYQE